MDSKKTHQLSKATIATVVAASGVLIAMPQPTNAYTFSDLNPHAFYYEPVTDLAKRNIATGYSNGTFLPNKAITREDAAKMLALAIDINITNPKNPRFKDVNANNPNYIYIAALSEAGIINGFTDNTFKPKEPITRAQMAKILTLGYKFGVSSKINNSFRDVSPSNFAAYYIQTLVDLNVTKGSSSVTFDPFKSVTRGEMATFIWRAQKADRGTPIYAVGDVSNDKIYINGVAHTIAPHLRSILNASNKNILKGAFIEGTYSGKTLTNITKLTLNASGTSSRLLALDGNYTSFAGELIINGSYVRMKDINFTGRVEVAQAPRRSLASLNNIRVASVNNMARFIDWGTPTDDKNEDFLNPEDNETLQDKPDPTKPSYLQKYTARMANIKAYVDFEGSDLRNLLVTADRAFVKSDTDIDRLTVRGDVTNFELYADATAMYLDNDYNMTVYGVNDIQYVYKNSLKNVHFNTDSTYEYYYVTSKSGYTNLGTHAYITNAIIPPNNSVINIFDDFETDEPQIDWIKDENGTTVPRDPVGDTVIPDVTSPEITQLDVKAGGTIADVTLTADEDGMYYYIVKKSTERPPTISEIKTGGVPLSGKGPVLMDEEVTFQVTDLESKTEYTIYAIVIDGSDNVSDKEERDFSTIDAKPPTIKLEPGAKMYGGKRVQFKVTPSEPGTIYYFIRPDSSAPKPTVDDVIEKNTGTIDAKTAGTITETAYKSGIKPNLADITPNTPYQIFAVMVDDSGNKMRLVEEIKITTEAPDTTNPYINTPQLVLEDQNKGYFYITVSEELDKETAENPANYLLSGTGIVNISGHKEMQPVEVQYSNKRIRLTIPSVSSLVNGDTIVANVLKGVKDLAENEFENADTVPVEFSPRNFAQYNHTDSTAPIISINNVITGTSKYEVEVETFKAGTYYYMILPENYDFNTENITNRDFVDEFSNDPNIVKGKFQTTTPLGVVDDYIASGQNPAPLGKFKFDVIKPTPPKLDPFTSYRIYMVLKDRSGQLSKIVDKPLINDSKPPLISGISISSIPNVDTKVKVNLTVDEKANFFLLPVKKYNKKADGSYELNTAYFDASGNLKDITDVLSTNATAPNLFDKFKGLGAVTTGESTGQGTFSFDSPVLTAHEEYGMYIGAVDSIGNFTILQRSSSPVLAEDEPKGPQMKATFYTDGTKPFIKTNKNNPYGPMTTDAIIYKTPDAKFEITFNEAILRQNTTNLTNYNKSQIKLTNSLNLSSIMKIRNSLGTDVTGQFIFDSYTVGSQTTDESQLVIKPTSSTFADQTITIELNDDLTNAYDYVGKYTFDLSKFGKFVYPTNQVNIMSNARLGIRTSDPNNSKQITITPQLSASDVKEVFYVVVNDGVTYSPTPAEILDVVKTGRQPQGVTINLYGKKLISTPADTSSEMTLYANGASNVFRSGQKVYMITLDRYGNINWVLNETDRTQNYSTVVN